MTDNQPKATLMDWIRIDERSVLEHEPAADKWLCTFGANAQDWNRRINLTAVADDKEWRSGIFLILLPWFPSWIN